MAPPYSPSLHRLRHPMFEFILFLVIFVSPFMITAIVFAPLSLPSFGSLVSSLPHQLDIKMLVWFFEFCVAAFFFSFLFFFLAFRLASSCRPSVGPSPGHIMGPIVPRNNNLFLSELGLRPARMYEVHCFVFISFLSFSFLLFRPHLPFFALFLNGPFLSSSSGVHMYHHHVPGVISQHVTRDGVRQAVMVPPPLRTGTAVRVQFCLLSSIETFTIACFVTTGWTSER